MNRRTQSQNNFLSQTKSIKENTSQNIFKPKQNNFINIENQRYTKNRKQSQILDTSLQSKHNLGQQSNNYKSQEDFTKYPSYNPFNPQKSYVQYSNKLQQEHLEEKKQNKYVIVDPAHPNSASNQQPVTYFFDKQGLTKQEKIYVNMLRAQNSQNLRQEDKFIDFMVSLESVRENSEQKLFSMKTEIRKQEKNVMVSQQKAQHLLKYEKPSKMDFLISQADQIKNKEEKKKHLEQLIRVWPAKNIIKNVKYYEAKKQLNQVVQEIKEIKRMKDKPVKYLYNKYKMAESLQKPLMVPILYTSGKQREHKPIDFSKPISIDFFNNDIQLQQSGQHTQREEGYEENNQENIQQNGKNPDGEKKDLVVWDKYGFKIRKQVKAVPIQKRPKKINVEQLLQQRIKEQQQQNTDRSQQSPTMQSRLSSPIQKNRENSILQNNQQQQKKKQITFQLKEIDVGNSKPQQKNSNFLGQEKKSINNNINRASKYNTSEGMNNLLQQIEQTNNHKDNENYQQEYQENLGNIQKQYDQVQATFENTRPGADIDKELLKDTQIEFESRFKQK